MFHVHKPPRESPFSNPSSSMSLFPTSFLFIITTFVLFLHHPQPISAAASHGDVRTNAPACNATCDTIPIKFPFGTGFGCGHPYFSRYIKCTNSGELQFLTNTGIYTVSSIDYSSSNVIITDPFMSTCSEMQNSGSFSLDKASPFTLTSDNIFVLLGCSTSSPLFDPDEDLCDTGSGSRVCKGLYSCKGVTGLGLGEIAPVSTCCVYDQSMLRLGDGNNYVLDLPKFQCSSYSSIYGFGGDEGDPMKWEYGISLGFNISYHSDECMVCERSGGFCGFEGLDESFACICRNGVNTTSNCRGQGYAWGGTRELKIQTKLCIGGFLLLWIVLLV